MSAAPMDLGITETDGPSFQDLFTSMRQPRRKPITVATGQNELSAGTIMSEDTDGTFIEWDGTKNQAGILAEDIDATSGTVNTILLFDCDVNINSLSGGTTIDSGFDAYSHLNIEETV